MQANIPYNLTMRVRSVELREIRMPLRFPYETSVGRTTQRRIILARVISTDGAEGWGECTADEDPYYSEEWTDGSWLILRDYLAPLLIESSFDHPAEVARFFIHVRKNRMAKAALETACWDLAAREANMPLWQYLGGKTPEVPAGVAIGLQPSVEKLLSEVEKESAAGYQRVKIKVKPGQDLELLKTLRRHFPDLPLMVDANSAYTLADLEVLRSFDEFSLMMIEQPLGNEDLVDHAALQKELRTPICLDESVCSAADANHAIELNACRIINLKLGRVGGYTSALEIERLCRSAGIPLWCGGMLESGVGRAHNVALATLGGLSLPADLSASDRYWEEDIIHPLVTVSAAGTVTASSEPGLGHEIDLSVLDRVTVRMEMVKS